MVAAQDEDEWIDPTDMLNYDPAAGRMKTPQKKEIKDEQPAKDGGAPAVSSPSAESGDTCAESCAKMCNEKLDCLAKELNECKGTVTVPAEERSCNSIFSRFLNRFLRQMEQFGLPSEANQIVHYDAEVRLSGESLSELEKFLKGDKWKPGLLDEALGTVLVDFKLHDPEAWKWKFEDTFGVELHTLLMVLGCLVLLFLVIATQLWACVSWFIQLKRILVISVIISLVWNWLYLYKTEFAMHHAKVVQMDKKVDDICIGLKKMDWKDSLFEWWRASFSFVDDPCKVYYETLLVNPVLLVPPARAISLTFTTFITEPFKHVGQAFGEFYKALLKDLPVQHQIPVIVMVLIGVLAFFYGFGSACTRIGNVTHLWDNNQPPPPLPYTDRNLPLPVPDYRGGGDAADGGRGQLPIRNRNSDRNERSANNRSGCDSYDHSEGAGISELSLNIKKYPDCHDHPGGTKISKQPVDTKEVPEAIPAVDLHSSNSSFKNASEECHSVDIIRKMPERKSSTTSNMNVQDAVDEIDFKDVQAPRNTVKHVSDVQQSCALKLDSESDLGTALDASVCQLNSSGKVENIGMEDAVTEFEDCKHPVPESGSSCAIDAPSFVVLSVEKCAS